jgi:hypothetical protein
MIIKAYVGVTFMMCLRWTLPRLRIDQVMTTCLKYCLPLVSIMLAGAMLWTFAFPGGAIHRFMPAASTQMESNYQPSEKKTEVKRKPAPPMRNNVDDGNIVAMTGK